MCWIENCLGMRVRISCSVSFSVSLWRLWCWKSSSKSQLNLITCAWLSQIIWYWFWIQMLWYSKNTRRNTTAVREAHISALQALIELIFSKFGLYPDTMLVSFSKTIIHPHPFLRSPLAQSNNFWGKLPFVIGGLEIRYSNFALDFEWVVITTRACKIHMLPE